MIQNSLTCSLCILFVYTVFQDGNILGRVGLFLEEHLPALLYKPLIGCVFCMAPWWSSLYYCVIPGKYDLTTHIVFILCVGGGNVVLGTILGYLKYEQSITKGD